MEGSLLLDSLAHSFTVEKEESEFETDEEVEEIIEEEEDEGDGENFNSFPTMEELTHHEWLLKNPRPPWVKARIRAGSPNSIKISCMLMTLGLDQGRAGEIRHRPTHSNISNFVGRITRPKVFIGKHLPTNASSMILEDTLA
ncbi:hypothetical protein Tco_0344969 [Tanacetum coccineum]